MVCVRVCECVSGQVGHYGWMAYMLVVDSALWTPVVDSVGLRLQLD